MVKPAVDKAAAQHQRGVLLDELVGMPDRRVADGTVRRRRPPAVDAPAAEQILEDTRCDITIRGGAVVYDRQGETRDVV